jgi:hypothetical protein
MANEINNALRAAADKVARYVENISNLTVTTRLIDVNQGAVVTDARAAARTVISLDGDCCIDLPVRLDEQGNPAVDGALYDLHERNVATAIEYRTRMMDALLQTLKQAARG